MWRSRQTRRANYQQAACKSHRLIHEHMIIARHVMCLKIVLAYTIGSRSVEACGTSEAAGSLLNEAVAARSRGFSIASLAMPPVVSASGWKLYTIVQRSLQCICQCYTIAVRCYKKATNGMGATNYRINPWCLICAY